jgi:hypothetical protein
LIPLLQWSAYSFDGSHHAIGWSGGRPIITSAIASFSEPIITTHIGKSYLIHPDSQGVNFAALFLLDRWLRSNNITTILEATNKYFLSNY